MVVVVEPIYFLFVLFFQPQKTNGEIKLSDLMGHIFQMGLKTPTRNEFEMCLFPWWLIKGGQG